MAGRLKEIRCSIEFPVTPCVHWGPSTPPSEWHHLCLSPANCRLPEGRQGLRRGTSDDAWSPITHEFAIRRRRCWNELVQSLLSSMLRSKEAHGCGAICVAVLGAPWLSLFSCFFQRTTYVGRHDQKCLILLANTSKILYSL